MVHVIYAALYTPNMATHSAPGLVPGPCCISCRQNIYFCLLRRLIRQKQHFSHPFSDLASKKLCHHFLDSTPTKEISYLHNYFSFFSCTFGIESKTIPDSRPKCIGKVYTHFQINTPQKPYPLGRHIPL